MSQHPDDNDWRLRGQETYLTGATLHWRAWHAPQADWDHGHCAFCWAKFMDRADVTDVLREGYTTECHWICANCAHDFAARFRFTLVGGPSAT